MKHITTFTVTSVFHDVTVKVVDRGQFALSSLSSTINHCEVLTCTAVTITALGFDYTGSDQTIEYTYDDLNRLTAADYDTGLYYHYTYDAVGNRTAQETAFVTDPLLPPTPTVTAYTFDDANRLATVNALPYTFDANGNLLSDGEYTYSYDTSNRLTGVTKAESTVSYKYNGNGDRLQQTVNGVENNYTLDLNSGLTQVLANGDETYSYGLDRLSYSKYDDMYTYLPDALGSVRQVMKTTGEYPGLSLAKSYDPYGEVIYSNGATASYGFTGEWTESTGMVYLRARYYNSSTGTFMSRDTWNGDANLPMSYNRWAYTNGNPVNYTDPSGMSSSCGDAGSGACGDETVDSKYFEEYKYYENCAKYGGPNCPRWGEVIVFITIGLVSTAILSEIVCPLEPYITTGVGSVCSDGNCTNEIEAIDGVFPEKVSQLSHIFRYDIGHITEDTLVNRELLVDTISPDNFIMIDRFGKYWFARVLENGQEVWVTTLNGIIQNGGINEIPRYFQK